MNKPSNSSETDKSYYYLRGLLYKIGADLDFKTVVTTPDSAGEFKFECYHPECIDDIVEARIQAAIEETNERFPSNRQPQNK